MNQNIQKLKVLENQGKVADSLDIRLSFIKSIDEGVMTLEEVQKELRKIQKEAHENGLYTRNDILSGKIVDFQRAKEKKVIKMKKNLDKSLNKKKSKRSIKKV